MISFLKNRKYKKQNLKPLMNSKYLQQLMFGCGTDCDFIFCKSDFTNSEEAMILISEHLAKYDDLFLCSNVRSKLLTFKKSWFCTNESLKKSNEDFQMTKECLFVHKDVVNIDFKKLNRNEILNEDEQCNKLENDVQRIKRNNEISSKESRKLEGEYIIFEKGDEVTSKEDIKFDNEYQSNNEINTQENEDNNMNLDYKANYKIAADKTSKFEKINKIDTKKRRKSIVHDTNIKKSKKKIYKKSVENRAINNSIKTNNNQNILSRQTFEEKYAKSEILNRDSKEIREIITNATNIDSRINSQNEKIMNVNVLIENNDLSKNNNNQEIINNKKLVKHIGSSILDHRNNNINTDLNMEGNEINNKTISIKKPIDKVDHNIKDKDSVINTNSFSSAYKTTTSSSLVPMIEYKCTENNSHSSFKQKSKTGTLAIDFKSLRNSEKTLKEDSRISIFLEFILSVLDMCNNRGKTLPHELCYELRKVESGEDLAIDCIIHAALRIFLLKYHETKDDFLGLITLRTFSRACFDHTALLSNYQLLLANLITDIYTRHALSHRERSDEYDFSPECLSQRVFSVRDFAHVVPRLVQLLDGLPSPQIRTDNSLEALLDALSLLYSLNTYTFVFPYRAFYLHGLCKRLNLKEEFRFSRARCRSVIAYSFALPIETKAELLKFENGDGMKASLQDAFFRSLYEGPTNPYLFVRVRRPKMYIDLCKLLSVTSANDLKKQIRIEFVGEEGVDSGGIRKEFFALLSDALAEDPILFVSRGSFLWLNGSTTNSEPFVILGKILGIALYNDALLNLPLPKLFFKKILNLQPELIDILEIEPEIYRSLEALKKLNSKELLAADISFDISYSMSQNTIRKVSLHSIQNKQVTSKNLNEFITKYVDYIANLSIKKQFSALKRGFDQIVPFKSISFLHHSELEKIIAGTTYINIGELRKNAILTNYKPCDLAVINFWAIFEEYNCENRKKLLQFITGNDRIPVVGNECLKLVILKNGCDTDRLPSSQTCFNTLLLPDYKSKEKMKEKLDKAITMTKGFYLM